MRIRVQRRGLAPAAVVAVVGTVVLYLAVTTGLASWQRQQQDSATPSGRGYLPAAIENAPSSIRTTEEYGPPGPVAVVYAGTEVDDGLRGTVDEPWITVSATTGDYRALTEPGLPPAGPGVVQVSPDGGLIVWTGEEGLVVYDTVTGDLARPGVDSVDALGPIAGDARHLLVHSGGAARVVDLEGGSVVAEADADAADVRGAAWRPDGTTVDLVTAAGQVSLGTDGGTGTRPTSVPAAAQLAWSPEGDRLVELHDTGGTFRMSVAELDRDGTLGPTRPLAVPSVSLQRLFGFSGTQTVTLDAFPSESGSVERVLDVPLGQGSPSDVTLLPPPGENWVDVSTLSVATGLLPYGSFAWESQVWPWSHTARLAACAITMFFLFGLYVTRRPRKR